MKEKYEVAIIGGGPAGVSAGIYAGRLRMKTILVTKNFSGQVGIKAVDIENYPGFESISGPDLAKRFENQIKKQGIDIENGEVSKISKLGDDFSLTLKSGKEIETMSVIMTTGADPRPLKIPGEKEFVGRGVTYCALCDGPVFADKSVAIIGGGNNGFETVIFLSKIVKDMHLLEFGDTVNADATNQELVARLDNIKIITGAMIKEIHGDKFVNSITYQDRKTGEEKKLAVSGVFVEIGYIPATYYAKGLVEFNDKGEVMVDRKTYQTNVAGIFSAGDLNEGSFKQIVIAAGEGASALLSAHEYLKTKRR